MEFFVLYLFVMLEQISEFLLGISKFLTLTMIFGGIVLGFVWAMFADIESKDSANKITKPFLRFYYIGVPILIICYTIGSLLPSPKQAAVIFGGGLAYQAVTSEKGQEVLGKVGGKIEHELDKLLSIPDEVVEK